MQLGPTKREDGSWRVRSNLEIENLVAEPNIIGEIKAHRLRWLGHVERMGEDRSVRKAYLGRPVGRRPVGRPKYRWKDRNCELGVYTSNKVCDNSNGILNAYRTNS
ncbi:hypothetical protein K1T71_011666 [Dendrolimus kikuchii]|uniref:Uncharacterized protein n=1 Tax=Dendrolimus kikuchii TaxID=765133 RepID=A0ACC1CM26_9NEOP|nr:hypothetical protein K1T71_011666 [Dendrolimus kikuchii]